MAHAGTQVGYHQYDTQLEDFSRKNIDAEIAALKSFEKRIERFIPTMRRRRFCSAERPRDGTRQHSRNLLTLETIRPGKRMRTTIRVPARMGRLC
jgi:hypothetical protein